MHQATHFFHSCLIIISLLVILLLPACRNRYDVDTSKVPNPNTHIVRYEQSLFQKKLTSSYLDSLQKEFPLFLGTAPLDAEQMNQLQAYVQNPFLDTLYQVSQVRFPSLNSAETALSDALRHIKYYYPQFIYPQVYTYISGNFDPAFIEDTTLVISIDRFLGPNCKLYDRAGIPKYQQAYMNSDYITRHVLSIIAKNFIPPVLQGRAQLLDHMLYEAKILFFIQHMCPNISATVLFEQTPANLKWLESKENAMWRYYVENEMLFKTSHMTYNKCIGQAPFSSIFGQESAPRTGIWLGYQILQSYQDKQGLALPEVLRQTNSQQILQQSGYKPE